MITMSVEKLYTMSVGKSASSYSLQKGSVVNVPGVGVGVLVACADIECSGCLLNTHMWACNITEPSTRRPAIKPIEETL